MGTRTERAAALAHLTPEQRAACRCLGMEPATYLALLREQRDADRARADAEARLTDADRAAARALGLNPEQMLEAVQGAQERPTATPAAHGQSPAQTRESAAPAANAAHVAQALANANSGSTAGRTRPRSWIGPAWPLR